MVYGKGGKLKNKPFRRKVNPMLTVSTRDNDGPMVSDPMDSLNSSNIVGKSVQSNKSTSLKSPVNTQSLHNQ